MDEATGAAAGADADSAAGDPAGGDSLARRYGPPSHARRRWRLALVGLVVAGLLGWVLWAAWSASRPTVGGQVHSYDVVSPHRVKVTVDLYRPTGAAASCVVRALAEDHTTVGEHPVRLPAGAPGEHTLVVYVRTERAATTATLASCG